MAEQTEKKRGGKAILILTPFLLLLMTGGILILCYSLAPTHRLQKYLNIAFMDNLKTTAQTDGLHIIENDISTNDTPSETFDKGEIIYPTFGEQYAMLQIESADIYVSVYYGVNAELLERGECQSTQSAIIGENPGNTVIDAHVTTFFSDLSKVKTGDTVKLYTKYGRFVYKVTEQIEFSKEDKRYLTVPKEGEYLTLYTCKPQVLGSPDQRVGVRCEPVEKQFYAQSKQEGGTQ
ncbi:MAG: class D sortase [Oscillospiraceae bacterium]|nr:class D sortase [Oscillospiraceae bacterium]